MLVEHDLSYYDSLEWVEVPMWKALKLWSNNKKHMKCVVGRSHYFYHGQLPMKVLNHDQVQDGKWFVSELNNQLTQ
ncbi:hypothetical protein ACFVS2_21070 [Brevibacillus sp. NPDC058079]|uniref:hypothetical protein n=1 Tax=Brevibacillus sp. NPDC058079 TaxID=3346330 RepID=UPI0036F177ED